MFAGFPEFAGADAAAADALPGIRRPIRRAVLRLSPRRSGAREALRQRVIEGDPCEFGGVALFGTGGAPGAGIAPFAPGCGVTAGTGVSTLPRMIGRPSLPLPITTTFAFCDSASSSVASMPRQRR